MEDAELKAESVEVEVVEKKTTERVFPFTPGHNKGGRPPGVPNKVTKQVKEIAQRLLTGDDYRKNLRRRLRDGTCPPAVETMLWHYAYGKPKETIAFDWSKLADAPLVVIEYLATLIPEGK